METGASGAQGAGSAKASGGGAKGAGESGVVSPSGGSGGKVSKTAGAGSAKEPELLGRELLQLQGLVGRLPLLLLLQVCSPIS